MQTDKRKAAHPSGDGIADPFGGGAPVSEFLFVLCDQVDIFLKAAVRHHPSVISRRAISGEAAAGRANGIAAAHPAALRFRLGACALSLFVAVLFRVRLRGFLTVLCCLMKMAGCSVSVVSRRLVITSLVMLAGLAMMSSCVLVVLGC
jgi:hypothetical protein